ncbi:MAG: energy transducer TonB [Elusimicrobiota bacterium]|nr:energy transducer TonB [Elusimicrobiota bacterium]
MLLRIQTKHDIICWTIAIGLHLLLFLMNFNLYKTGEAKRLIPIVEVEYISYEDIIKARRVRVSGEPPETFKEKVKHFFSKKVEPARRETVLTGKAPAKLKADEIKGIFNKDILVDKKGSLSQRIDLPMKNRPGDESKEKLLYKEESVLVVSQEPKPKSIKLRNLEDKGYKVSKRDLPFDVSARERIRRDEDIVGVDLDDKTSEGILTQAPSLEDIRGKESFGEGVFRVVKQEAEGKLSGSEVLVNLLVMAKKEEERRLEESGGGLSSEGILTGEEGHEGSAEGSVSGEGSGEVGSGSGVKGTGGTESGTGTAAGSSTGTASKGGYLKEAGAGEQGEKRAFRKGVVFSRAPATGSGSGGSESSSGADRKVAKKEHKGRVIFEIRGPLSHRTVLYRELPPYPEWAEKEGIEAGVSVHFVVLSNGKVKDNIYVVKTSGYPVLDKLVMEALRNWKFAALKGDIYGKEEWGVLTFYFSLEGGT